MTLLSPNGWRRVSVAYIAIASGKLPRHWVALLDGEILIYARVLTPYAALSCSMA